MIPLDITVREVPNSAAIAYKIRQKVSKLSQYCRRVEFCKVIVSVVQKQQHKGKLYSTHIEVGVPGKILVSTHQIDEDLYVVIRDAFAAVNKQVKRYTEEKQGLVKTHLQPLVGKVARKFSDYGFIETAEGIEYYFNAHNTLHEAFDQLEIGSSVSFLDNTAGDSLQASHVAII